MDHDKVRARDGAGMRTLRRSLMGPGVVLVLATGIVVAAVLSYPDRSNLALHAYLVLIGFVVLWSVAGAVSQAFASGGQTAIEQAVKRRRLAPATLREIQQIELGISLSTVSGLDPNSQLRRLLRRLAVQRLSAHRNVNLESDPALAKILMGDQLWAAITGDARSANHNGAAVPIEELEQAVNALESI
jgi:hypothetical protein